MQILPARVPLRLLVVATLTATLAAACGGEKAESTDSAAADSAAAATTAATTAAAPAAATPAADPNAALTVEDIDRWQRGMEAELQAVRDAGTKLKEAKSGTDSLNAVASANDMATRSAGAQAAGVDEERYQRIRTKLSEIVGQLSPLEQEMNVSQMPANMVAEMKKSREQGAAQATAGLAPEVVEALRTRAADLRKQDLTLTGERLKAAGVGR